MLSESKNIMLIIYYIKFELRFKSVEKVLINDDKLDYSFYWSYKLTWLSSFFSLIFENILNRLFSINIYFSSNLKLSLNKNNTYS